MPGTIYYDIFKKTAAKYLKHYTVILLNTAGTCLVALYYDIIKKTAATCLNTLYYDIIKQTAATCLKQIYYNIINKASRYVCQNTIL